MYDESNALMYTADLTLEQKACKIRVFNADMTQTTNSYDIAVVSAFKGDYIPVYGTLIGALHSNRNISVEELSINPEIDMRLQGCWLSREINDSVKRVACIELLDLSTALAILCNELDDSAELTLLRSSFLTLRHLLEIADDRNCSIHNIAMPILGTGNQGISMEYVAAPLFTQCINMFKTIKDLQTIDFYELNSEKASKLCGILDSLIMSGRDSRKDVFISYSTKQINRAHKLRDALEADGLSVWIAPEGIPPGSDYLEEIPSAIANAKTMVVMLTPDAVTSSWVKLEVASAIGSGKRVLPVQLMEFKLDQKFQFMLSSSQILYVWPYDEIQQDYMVLSELRKNEVTL